MRRPYARRRRRAIAAANAGKTGALLVSRPDDVSYLSGFSGEDSLLLAGPRWSVLLTDGRFAEQADAECSDVEIHVRTGPMAHAVADALSGRGVRRLAVQSGHMTLAMRDRLAEQLVKVRIVPAGEALAELRMVKDADEIAAIRRAVRIAEKAFRQLTAGGCAYLVGRTERDVAAELDYLMRRHGADGPSFDTIVATGPHSSLPHYRPGSTRIRANQPLLIDWGARSRGYCSDLTRTLLLGRIPPEISTIHDVVRRAQSAGIEAIRSGRFCRTADEAARRVIEEAGYGDRFVHGLGHGLGRAVHEGPGVGRRSETRFRRGMVATVEPGVYLPGVGGVRIEDDVLVAADGAERLSRLPRSMNAMSLQ